MCLSNLIFSVIANQGIKKCVNEVGIGFMISPKYHPAMKIVRPVRKKLKVRTIFNILGPMLNPAQAPYAVVGVYTEDLVSSIPSDMRLISYIFLISHP
jgi:anthranilate phosphoribosyltransferase